MMMTQVTNVNCFIRIIFAQFILLTVINAQYLKYDRVPTSTEDYIRESDTVRERRAPPFHRTVPPDTLTATIRDGNEETHFTWKRAERHLANKHLPVYTARINSWGTNHRKSDVMGQMGNFIMYHDLIHKSAIILLENKRKIYGIVGRRLRISELSIDLLSEPLEVDGTYIRRLTHRPHGRQKYPRDTVYSSAYNNSLEQVIKLEQSNMSSFRTRREVTPDPFYVEVLLFVTHDIVQKFRSELNEGYLSSLIISYLLQLNGVDMIYANLPVNDFNIHINLAGVILEEDDGAFSQITRYLPLKYENNPVLNINFLFEDFARYPNYIDFPFKKDSFDLIYISTGRELEFGRRKPVGWHSNAVDIFTERQQDRISSVPKIIVRSTSVFSSYCIVAYEIGKILGIQQSDPFDLGITEDNMQCYGIMQSSQHHCSECMKWSDESTNQLKAFLRENRNRCWLLNKPRSLHPEGTIMVSHTPCRQCTCFGYHSYADETENECPFRIPSNACDVPLQCKHKDDQDELTVESTILPLDGTPCDESRVCWDGECTTVGKARSFPAFYETILVNNI